MRPLLVTTAHNSGHVPYPILADMLGDAALDPEARRERQRYLYYQGDPFTDAIFYTPGARHLTATASRFVADLNRRRDHTGINGTIKLTDFDGRPLYPEGFRLDADAAEARLATYWDPFHSAFARELNRPEIAFFLDGHAMVPVGPTIGPDLGAKRPAFNLITGGDVDGEPLPGEAPTSIPGWLSRALVPLLEQHFAPVLEATPEVPPQALINIPFAIGGIQRRYSDPAGPSGKPGLSLEINQALYLETGDDGLERPIPGRVEALNALMRVFVDAATPLFLEVPGAPVERR